MFSLFRKKDAPLQLYGKLPLARDYLRVGCAEGLGRSLRAWMDDGFSTGLAADERRDLAGPVRLLLAEGSKALQGILLPSTDASGLRSFPFLLAVERSGREVGAELRENPGRTFALWSELERIAATHGSHGDATGFLAAMRETRISSADLSPTPLPGVDVLTWTEALWPMEGTLGLAPILEELRDRERRSIQLPLAPTLPVDTQVAAWLALLAEGGHLVESDLPTLLFPLRSEGAGHLGAGSIPFDGELARRLAVPGPAFDERGTGHVAHALGESLLHAFRNAP